MNSLKETFQDLLTHYQFLLHKSFDKLRDILRFYTKLSFLKKDLYRTWLYRSQNAFSVSRNYKWKDNAYGLDIYCETPLSTLNTIAQKINLLPNDTVYDLGSSSGKTSFSLNEFYNCHVVGIELNPEFHKKACQILAKYPCPGVTFRNENFLNIDYSQANAVYCYCTGLQDEGVKRFLKALQSARKGTKIITVSVPIGQLDENQTLSLVKTIQGYYYWRKATVYIYEKL